MIAQLYYEDVTEGQDLPPLVENPTTRTLVKWACGSGDFQELHYDKEFAESIGLENIIVHGRLKVAWLAQMITDWIGAKGVLKKIYDLRFRGMDSPGKQITCGGTVKSKFLLDGEYWVECDIWTENTEGKKQTTATGAFTLPSRG